MFLDETGTATNMTRRYGRCPSDQRLVAAVPTLRRALAGIGAVELASAVVAAGTDPTDTEEDELP